MLGEFRPNTSYECAVFAVNSAAQGPSSTVRFNTTDESKFFKIIFSKKPLLPRNSDKDLAL